MNSVHNSNDLFNICGFTFWGCTESDVEGFPVFQQTSQLSCSDLMSLGRGLNTYVFANHAVGGESKVRRVYTISISDVVSSKFSFCEKNMSSHQVKSQCGGTAVNVFKCTLQILLCKFINLSSKLCIFKFSQIFPSPHRLFSHAIKMTAVKES
jgi:hypothetical protein